MLSCRQPPSSIVNAVDNAMRQRHIQTCAKVMVLAAHVQKHRIYGIWRPHMSIWKVSTPRARAAKPIACTLHALLPHTRESIGGDIAMLNESLG